MLLARLDTRRSTVNADALATNMKADLWSVTLRPLAHVTHDLGALRTSPRAACQHNLGETGAILPEQFESRGRGRRTVHRPRPISVPTRTPLGIQSLAIGPSPDTPVSRESLPHSPGRPPPFSTAPRRGPCRPRRACVCRAGSWPRTCGRPGPCSPRTSRPPCARTRPPCVAACVAWHPDGPRRPQPWRTNGRTTTNAGVPRSAPGTAGRRSRQRRADRGGSTQPWEQVWRNVDRPHAGLRLGLTDNVAAGHLHHPAGHLQRAGVEVDVAPPPL